MCPKSKNEDNTYQNYFKYWPSSWLVCHVLGVGQELLEHVSAEFNTTHKTWYLEEEARASNKRKSTEEVTDTTPTIADSYATYLEIDTLNSAKNRNNSKTTIKTQKQSYVYLTIG